MYDGGSKDWKDGWPTEKYEKYEKKSQEIRALHTEQCCLYVGTGTAYTYSGSKEKIGGATLKPIPVADWS